MKKIPTLYLRSTDDPSRVTNTVNPECKWVLDGEGEATQKFDGTCCLLHEGHLYKRHAVAKDSEAPEGFTPAGDPDPDTGKQVGWLPVTNAPEDQWHLEALRSQPVESMPPGTYELCGPKVQGNPEQCKVHRLIRHGTIVLKGAPRTFGLLMHWLKDKDIEGIVWHHPDGRMAKIKLRDFGITRKPQSLPVEG